MRIGEGSCARTHKETKNILVTGAMKPTSHRKKTYMEFSYYLSTHVFQILEWWMGEIGPEF